MTKLTSEKKETNRTSEASVALRNYKPTCASFGSLSDFSCYYDGSLHDTNDTRNQTHEKADRYVENRWAFVEFAQLQRPETRSDTINQFEASWKQQGKSLSVIKFLCVVFGSVLFSYIYSRWAWKQRTSRGRFYTFPCAFSQRRAPRLFLCASHRNIQRKDRRKTFILLRYSGDTRAVSMMPHRNVVVGLWHGPSLSSLGSEKSPSRSVESKSCEISALTWIESTCRTFFFLFRFASTFNWVQKKSFN